jgi:small nuclear ribonucleoprotein (snRNP)-like protein
MSDEKEKLMPLGMRRFTISLVLVASLLLPSATSAQIGTASTSDWSALNTVATGSKLSVKLKNGKTVEGKLSGVSDTALSLSVKEKPVDIKREDVFSVHQTSKKSATKATLIGAGVGAGAGAAIGLAGSSQHDSFDKIDQAVTAGLTVIGAGVGALTGYLIGRGGSKRVLIYEAR